MSSIEQQNAAVQQECGACGAEAGEECAPLCLGVAAAQDEAECCDPCSAGEHAADGTGTPCQCCGAVCPELVQIEHGDLMCVCGNTPSLGGWDTTDASGLHLEPDLGSAWDGHYTCGDCGRVVRPATDAAGYVVGDSTPVLRIAAPEPWCNHDAVAVVNGWCECGVYVGITR